MLLDPGNRFLGERSWRKMFLEEKCSWEKDPRRKRFLGEKDS
jgi:hypothetical protein